MPLRKHEMSETRQLGIALVIIGGLVLAGAAFAYAYQETTTETIPEFSFGGIQVTQPTYYDVTTTPYKDYAVPLIIGSVALFVVGFALMFSQSRNLAPAAPRSTSTVPVYPLTGLGKAHSGKTSRFPLRLF